MKKVMSNSLKGILMMMVALSCSLVSAQPQGGGQGGGQQGPPPVPSTKEIKTMVSSLAQQLSMTEEQEAKVLVLYKNHFEEIKSEMSSNSRPSRTEMENKKAAFETKVKAVLTEEQQTKYAAYLKEQLSKRPSRR
ncbi:hypothetical protein [Saccharicrinis fermentans]|uniref:Periplasmic protein n=1 Tax=Saccharicrinis fermentans DSM 9555 = JCM 21142 TaxID=869213 RepID=W7YG92_9BACT|nr:hypothetical protein [Saccharicrinis fermentans]GAF01599.1 hypothetical protein JCM21142_211 [Saccharicrinis fermentans DSM 9555 = JCM 21142]